MAFRGALFLSSLRFWLPVCLICRAAGQDNGAASSTSLWSVFGRSSPLAFFSALGSLDLEAQKRYLNATGAQLQHAHGLACNVFGGSAACMPLSPTSKFAQLCPNHDLKVDCAYYTDDTIEVEEDPVDSVHNSLQSLGLAHLESACPACFANQRALWCAQTVPKCGSYSAYIEDMLLPAISKVTKAAAFGLDPVEALSQAVPDLVTASSLAMPCRAMCEAVVSSCSCTGEQRFGPLLEAFVNSHSALGAMLPPGFTTQLFGSVYDVPLCSLYGNSSDARFAGTCDQSLRTSCEDTAAWCNTPGQSNAGAQLVQELMAGQLANALFGWIDAPANNVFDEARAIIDDADGKDEESLENQYLHVYGSGQAESKSSAAAVAHWTVFAVCAVAAIGAGVAFWQWRRRQNQTAEGYLAMSAMDDESEAGQPMVAPTTSLRQSM